MSAKYYQENKKDYKKKKSLWKISKNNDLESPFDEEYKDLLKLASRKFLFLKHKKVLFPEI